MFPDVGVLAPVTRNLSQPDDGLNRLDLAEERPKRLFRRISPILQQPRRRRGYAPVGGVRDRTPRNQVLADLIDDAGDAVGLATDVALSAEIERRLCAGAAPLSLLARLRHRCDVPTLASALDRRMVKRLAVRPERVMPRRNVIWRVENGLFVKRLGHVPSRSVTRFLLTLASPRHIFAARKQPIGWPELRASPGLCNRWLTAAAGLRANPGRLSKVEACPNIELQLQPQMLTLISSTGLGGHH